MEYFLSSLTIKDFNTFRAETKIEKISEIHMQLA